MKRVLKPILGLAAIAAVVVASVLWLRDHEADGRSPYEKVFGGEQQGAAVPPLKCFPRSPETSISDLNQNPAANDALVPAGPRRLLLCRYRGMNHGKQSLRLAKSRLVSEPSVVRLIADGLNELSRFPDGTFSCPFDEGARTYALFAYPDQPSVVVELAFEGCPAATNGRADVAWLENPVARRVRNLVPLR